MTKTTHLSDEPKKICREKKKKKQMRAAGNIAKSL